MSRSFSLTAKVCALLVLFGAAALLAIGLNLLGTSHALEFNHVPDDKDGDHLVDISDPQPNVYCGYAHADVNLDGVVDLSGDILSVISAYGNEAPLTPLHDQNHNDIVDHLDIAIVINHYSPGGYDCSGATPDPTPVPGLGATSGPDIVHDGPGSLTGGEGSITVTVSTAGVATDPYGAFNIALRFNTGVVQGTSSAYSGIVGGTDADCLTSFVNTGQGQAAAFCPTGFIGSVPTTAVGPLMEFTFDVIAAGDPEFCLVSFGAPDNGGAFGGTYTVGADVAPQIQTVQGCVPITPTPCPTEGCPTVTSTPTITPTPTPTITPTPKSTPKPDCRPGCPPEMVLTVKGGDCDDPVRPTKCDVPFGSPFHLGVHALGIPANGYIAIQTFIDYGSDLVYKQEPWEDEILWPDALVLAGGEAGPGLLAHGALTSPIPPSPQSTYVGKLVAVSMNCPDASTVTTVELLPYNDPVAGTNGSAFFEDNTFDPIIPIVGSLTINCVEPVPPPFIPAQGDIFPVAGGSVGDTLPAIAAALSSPVDVAVDEPGGPQIDVYIADRDHCRIRLIAVGGTTTTIAGTGECGYGGDTGLAVNAQLNNPTGVDVDDNGNIYIADEGNCRVRMVDTSGIITTVAGSATCGFSGDGDDATLAQLDGPYDVLVVDGKDLLIVDRGNCRVRKVDISTDIITTVAGSDPGGGPCDYSGDGGPATSAQLNDPRRLALDALGNLYIADGGSGNCRVRVVDTSGDINPFAGDGTCSNGADGGLALTTQLNEPDGLAFDDSTGDLYIADLGNCRVRVVSGGNIANFAGDSTVSCGYSGDFGEATSAQLNAPSGMAFDSSQRLYIADRDNHRIRRVGSPITTIAGTGLPDFCGDTFVAIDESCLDSPHDVAIDDAGDVYIADVGNHRIRVIDAGTGSIDTLVGKSEQTNCPNTNTTGVIALELCLEFPRHIVVSPDSNYLYISDEGRNQIWSVHIPTGFSSRMAGAANGAAGSSCPDDTTSLLACLDQPRGLALQQVGGNDKYLFVAQGGSNGAVLRIDLDLKWVRKVFQDPDKQLPLDVASSDVALGPGNSLYIAQPGANRVRWVDTGADPNVDGNDDPPVTVAGSGTPGLTMTDGIVATLADLDGPHAVAMNKDSDLLISDRNNHRLWVVRKGDSTPDVVDGEPSERIYRIAGGGTPTPGFCGDPKAKPDPTPPNAWNARDACLNLPADLSYDYYLNLDPDPPISRATLYFADELNHRVRKIDSDCDDDGLTDAVELAGIQSIKPELGKFFTLKCKADTDGDGCSDAEEVGSNEAGGGRRDPENPWDFYDVSGLEGGPDGVIDLLFDILGVIQHYSPTGAPPYDAAFDRGPTTGPNAWNMTAPDGVIDLLNDILGVIRQYGHDCR